MEKSLIELLSKRTYQEEQSIIDGNIDDYYYQDNSKTVKIKKMIGDKSISFRTHTRLLGNQ